MDLATLFERVVIRAPDAVAIVDGNYCATYDEWRDEIRGLAGGLRTLGLKPGDHFVPILSNRREMASLYWACQMLGVIFTPFNWRATVDEITYVLKDAETVAIAYEARSADAAIQAADRCGISRRIDIDSGIYAQLTAHPPIAPPARRDDDETCLMLYTSGTTGRPKGVPRSHAAERLASTHCVAQLGYDYRESCLGVMPLFHTMGIRALTMSALVNGKFVCMPAFNGADALQLIEKEQITAMFLVPTMFHDMLSHPGFDGFDTASVSNLGYAGMAMTSDLTARCAAAFKPRKFTNYYGSSEIYTFTFCDHVIDKPGCAGRASIGQEIRVVRADPDGAAGPDEILPRGKTGEIIAPLDGLEAFSGYWKRPDADAKAIRQGWYFTGDLGAFDEDGELYVVGRVDDMIISGGENIHPEEVEDLLDASPLVARAAVVGLPDERWGQKVVAFIEPASDAASADALDAACLAGDLARFKRPRAYVFVEQIPCSASGKLLRRFLRDGDYSLRTDYKSTL
ncbi:MAG: AMP-binding protein [Pseudomonadota bacterium]|nr:AMP-binding protein [Pseudomonadota bacterium]